MKNDQIIVNRNEMRKMEALSGRTTEELLHTAGQKVASFIIENYSACRKIMMIAGNGNNGGDALKAAEVLQKTMDVSIYMIHGQPKTDAALTVYNRLDSNLFIREYEVEQTAENADLILDGVYGFGYHGTLNEHTRKIFRRLNPYRNKTLSIDINSGCECDSGFCDRDALTSHITLALEAYKPFHMFRKEHHMFDECVRLSLDIPHNVKTSYFTMDEETFFSNLKQKEENAYKTSEGKTLLVSGSYGMAGAACLNILGAQSMGASYIMSAVPDAVYPICAGRFTTPVFLPYSSNTCENVLIPAVRSASIIACGSGMTNLDCKNRVNDLVLQNANCPVILDAEALRLLVHNTYLFRFIHVPVIITPHIGEFAALTGKPAEYIQDHREECAEQFARQYHVYVVLKGANTVVVSPDGRKYINQSGCPALAQAGSGDLLTGIMAGTLNLSKDIFTGICMAVWFHGFLSEYGLKYHSIRHFPLECYPQLADELFRKHGF
ncbi:MAG: NAD(P)H-hydrate dehydratase [Bulleidia sp.]